jgi:CRP-like cAMP-binding protein
VADSLYIVRFGVVSIQKDGEELCEAKRGDLFGENALLGLCDDGGRRTRTCVAKTSCELCQMTAAQFFELMHSCKDLQRRCRVLVQVWARVGE